MTKKKTKEEWISYCEKTTGLFDILLNDLEKYLQKDDMEQIKEYVDYANEFGLGLELTRDCIIIDNINIPLSIYNQIINLKNIMNLTENIEQWEKLKLQILT